MPSSLRQSPSELIIGTYTERLPHVAGKAEGILSCPFDGGTFGPLRVLAETRNPSFLVLSPDGRRLYAVNETVQFEGRPGGGVTAFSRDDQTGELNELNTRSSGGVEPAHLELSPNGRFLLVANYRSGSVAVFLLEADGGMGPMTDHVQHEGSSVHPVRQSGPHAHMVLFDPGTGDVLVPDLGLDAVFVYGLTDDGKLIEKPHKRIQAAPGAGPRHLAFHPGGQYLFVLNELDNTLAALRREGESFVTADVASTLPPEFHAHSQAAALRVSPSGRCVLASNRGPESDSIALFSFDEVGGTLKLAGTVPTHGREPREFILSADGRSVIVANQDSDTLELMELDEDEPRLRHVSTTSALTPVCLRTA